MFDRSKELIVGQSDEIFGVTQTSCEDSSWRQLSFVNDEEVISLSHAKVYVFFKFCVVSWNGDLEPNIKYYLGRKKLSCFKDSPHYRILETIDGEPMEFDWTIFPGFTTLQLINKVQEFMTKMGDPSRFKGRIMSMFNDVIWWSNDLEQECELSAQLFSIFATRFPAGRWSFLGTGSEKKWYSIYNETELNWWWSDS